MQSQGGVVILDFGSQFTQLIARRVRELGVHSAILPFHTPISEIKKYTPKAIILSGGPSSVYEDGAPTRDLKEILQIAPTLGLCYGMQLLAHQLGGKVQPGTSREYGRMKIHLEDKGHALFKEISAQNDFTVWMSHGDSVLDLPKGVKALAKSESGFFAAMGGECQGQKIFGFQFHPEVSHTENGTKLIENFLFEICKVEKNWKLSDLSAHLIEEIKNKVNGYTDGGVKAGTARVLVGLSGGVDSTVAATLVQKAIGKDRTQCVFVDTGLLRFEEAKRVKKAYEQLDLNVKYVDASKEFLSALKGEADPEKKRKAIGKTFIDVFDHTSKDLPCEFLAQGTLYPDVIESVSLRGASVTIKTHHNVGGLPEKMKMKLVEPLRELFKDEVRRVGLALGIPQDLIGRHPFPGPGLAVRILGAVDETNLNVLRQADEIFISELKKQGLYDQIWQAFAVLLPIHSVGVMGDGRTYEKVVALRAVTSLDGMTADWYKFSGDFLASVSNRITNEVRGINRVVYDISSKPPATIEWE